MAGKVIARAPAVLLAAFLASLLAGLLASSPSGARADAAAGKAACFPADVAPGPGTADPFKPPDPKATAHNAAGKTFYREGKWEEARAEYRAAVAADADFRAPTLNIACSFVRQERFAEAIAEVRKLLEGGYVPWAREILEATDLGALKVRPEMAAVQQAMADAAGRWGAGLPDDLFFVARLRPPLRVPATGAGVFILGPQQEVYAWSPVTGRYRQLTAEDGRVLAVLAAPDRRRLLYVTGEKLVRAADGAEALRGVAVRTLDLATMSLGPSIPIAGDVTRLELETQSRQFLLRVAGDKIDGRFVVEPQVAVLMPRAQPAARPATRITGDGAANAVVIAARGVAGPREQRLRGACPLLARNRDSKGEGGVATIEIIAPGRKPLLLKTRLGAGLHGLVSH
ncbi:MAG TPA: tetratricopeptide repeat protein [Polyangia bacterium]|nr:tetratricopeptide repeat protein [Polyangia bacterium]